MSSGSLSEFLGFGALAAGGLSVFYGLLQRFLRKAWQTIPGWEIPDGFIPQTTVSVIIPARNEERTIVACLQSILGQSYPAEKIEILVIDDHSSDLTPNLVAQISDPRLRLLSLADWIDQEHPVRSFKKKALEVGIDQAAGELIVTTDADCVASPDWLCLLVSYYQARQPAILTAPVCIHREKRFVEQFQSLDMLGMMLLTGAGNHQNWFHLANGANLAYPKRVFQELGGFSGIDHLASGDDILFVHKVVRHYPERIGFVKSPDATVYTLAQPSWPQFFRQRLRWATKTTGYQQKQVTLVVALVFLYCFSIFVSLLAIPFGGLPIAVLFLGQVAIKSWADFRMLDLASRFFRRPDLMRYFWPAQLAHIVYWVIVGILGNLVRRYDWKGRRVK